MRAELRSILSLAMVASLSVQAEVGPFEVLQRVGQTTRAGNYGRFPQTQPREGEDKTLAPYFHLANEDRATEQLPLKETSARIDIAGVIARVKVRQVFENTGSNPIEAIYVFPASTRAAVHGMRMKIGSRTLEAKIDKREAARQSYEAARNDGYRASLLEQQRPNVFTMNVANIMPRDRIEVELDYSELLVPESNTYELVYPTVVGPRYGGGADPQKDSWISNPYLTQGQPEPYKFDVQVHVESGMALQELVSPSHKVDVVYASPTSADVKLLQQAGGNKDFILRYRLAGSKIDTGLLLYEGVKEKFFTLLVEPPRRPTAEQIPAREYIFLVDVSGSMNGFPLETSKALMHDLLSKLKPTDTFNIVLFAGASRVMSPDGSIPATAANIQTGWDLVNRQSGGGGTQLMDGLKNAYGIPKRDSQAARTVVTITDGFVGVEAQSFKLIREKLGEANHFAFGIGSSVNRGLIEAMARAGQGEPFVVLNPSKAAEEADRFRQYIQTPLLANIKVRFTGFDAYEVSPSKLADLMADRPLVLFGKYRGAPAGSIEITGTTGNGIWRQRVQVASVAPRRENEALRSLWARKWVETLQDEHNLGAAKELEEAITDLGLSYKLLTAFTSFVAIDSERVNPNGQSATVKQPLPLPEGVSNHAVGAPMKASMGMGRGAGGYGSSADSAAAPPPPTMGMGGTGTRSYKPSLERSGVAQSGASGAAIRMDPAAKSKSDERSNFFSEFFGGARKAAQPVTASPQRSKDEAYVPPPPSTPKELEKKVSRSRGVHFANRALLESRGLTDLIALIERHFSSLSCEGAQTFSLRLTLTEGAITQIEIVQGTSATRRCISPQVVTLVGQKTTVPGRRIVELDLSVG